jgi:hypothetical protein
VTADGTYDGGPVYRTVAEHQPEPPVALIIPPRATATPSAAAETTPSQRDEHIQMIRDKGHLAWQKAVGYGRRSLWKPPCPATRQSSVVAFVPGLCLLRKPEPALPAGRSIR